MALRLLYRQAVDIRPQANNRPLPPRTQAKGRAGGHTYPPLLQFQPAHGRPDALSSPILHGAPLRVPVQLPLQSADLFSKAETHCIDIHFALPLIR